MCAVDGKDLELIATNTPNPAGSVHRLAICGHHVWIPKSSQPRFAFREVVYMAERHPREIAAGATARNRGKQKSNHRHRHYHSRESVEENSQFHEKPAARNSGASRRSNNRFGGHNLNSKCCE